jgi:hypothetical protein
MVKNVYWSSCRVPFTLVRFEWNSIFLDSSSNNTQMSNFMKFRPVGAELFHADRRKDGQTDMMNRIAVFRNFANAPAIYFLQSTHVILLKQIK